MISLLHVVYLQLVNPKLIRPSSLEHSPKHPFRQRKIYVAALRFDIKFQLEPHTICFFFYFSHSSRFIEDKTDSA